MSKEQFVRRACADLGITPKREIPIIRDRSKRTSYLKWKKWQNCR